MRVTPTRREAVQLTLGAGAFAAMPSDLRAQAFPDRPIRVIVPLAAASAVDVALRLVVDEMGRDLGQSFVVENQPGASGIVGMRSGARAAPDGYTILGVNDSIMAMLPAMKDDVGYDPVADFVPITELVTINFALIANPSFLASNVEELIALAKQKPGAIDYGSGGPGSPQHVAMELLMHATGIKLNHVPYRGVTQAFNDVVGGHIPLMITGLPAPNDLIKAGSLKLLGITSARRSPVFPDQPTIAEQGVPGFDFTTYGALVAPAKTPSGVIARLNQSAVKAMRTPAIQKRLEGMGFEVIANSPTEFTAALKAGIAKYDALAKAANIRL
jgi:tripartite-type tricarboxylate transporter receptor subunit TctC